MRGRQAVSGSVAGDWLAYRGIGAVAEATGVQLGMFDRVSGQVHLKAGRVRVTTVTVVALVRLVFVVLPAVRLVEGGQQQVISFVCYL